MLNTQSNSVKSIKKFRNSGHSTLKLELVHCRHLPICASSSQLISGMVTNVSKLTSL